MVCRNKGAAGRHPFRKECEFSRGSITQIICVFDLINSYLSSCKALWSLTAFEVKVLSLAMVAIETHGLKPKRLFILDNNFHVPFTMSLKHGKVQVFVLGKTTQMSLRSQILQ